MVDIEPNQLLKIYGQNIRNLEDPDDLCMEVLSLLVTRDIFEKLQLSDDQRRRLDELDDQLVGHWEIVAECLPGPNPPVQAQWWWFLHEGPQVREAAGEGAPAA